MNQLRRDVLWSIHERGMVNISKSHQAEAILMDFEGILEIPNNSCYAQLTDLGLKLFNQEFRAKEQTDE